MIRDEMRNKMKSEHDVVAHLRDWFNGNNNKLNKAYLWFSPNPMIWPWKLRIWKPGILPKLRLAFWLFAHGKFLTKDRQPYVICALCKCDNESFFQHCFSCVIRQMNYGGRRETGWGWRKQWSCYRGSSKVANFRISVIAGPYTTYGTWGINSCLMGQTQIWMLFWGKFRIWYIELTFWTDVWHFPLILLETWGMPCIFVVGDPKHV